MEERTIKDVINSAIGQNKTKNNDKDMGIISSTLKRAVIPQEQAKGVKRPNMPTGAEPKGLGNIELDIPDGIVDEQIRNWFEVFGVDSEGDKDLVRGLYRYSGGDLDRVLQIENKLGGVSGTGQLQNLYNYMKIKSQSDKLTKELSNYEDSNSANEKRWQDTSRDNTRGNDKDYQRDAKGRFIKSK